jgi:chorismate mutase
MDIDGWRARIDRIDEELVELLNERAKCAVEIGQIKCKNAEQIYDPKREQRVLERVTSLSSGPLTDDAMRRLFERIIDESRRLERLHAEQNGPVAADAGSGRGERT